uniref:Uncharacterized protein n=1 Tax=Panagrolaimus superbus TaxID=310955 RepID=A0A914ZDB7_9BILA
MSGRIYYSKEEEFKWKKVLAELLMGREAHSFAGIVKCKNGASIHPSKARVEVVDYNLRDHEREMHSLHDKAHYTGKSASFKFPAFTGQDKTLVRYIFHDVCFVGQEIVHDAFIDHYGVYILE